MFSKSPLDNHAKSYSPPDTPPKLPKKKDSLDDPYHTPPNTFITSEQSPSRKGKYTGCNCSKSQCLKMYCACFSVGRMCDEVLDVLFRLVCVKAVKIVVIIWKDLKL